MGPASRPKRRSRAPKQVRKATASCVWRERERIGPLQGRVVLQFLNFFFKCQATTHFINVELSLTCTSFQRAKILRNRVVRSCLTISLQKIIKSISIRAATGDTKNVRSKILTRDVVRKMKRSESVIVAPPWNVDVATPLLARDRIMLSSFFFGVEENLIQTLQNSRLLEGNL